MSINLIHETLKACPEINDNFNFHGVNPLGGGRFYLDGANLAIYKEQFSVIESIVKQAEAMKIGFPKTNCDVQNPVLWAEYGGLCSNIGILPLTKTGKVPKFPVEISFVLGGDTRGSNDFFGTLGMFPNGKIGKAFLVRWKNQKCYTVNASIKDNVLSIQRINLRENCESAETNLYVREK